MKNVRTITAKAARRLAIVSQRLGGSRPPADAKGILETVRALRYLQLDPTNAVARSHLLVLWSRLGRYDQADLNTLLWKERRLFEYVAYIVPTEDYPIYAHSMRRFGTGRSAWPARVREFMQRNSDLRHYIVATLRRNGPTASRDFEDRSALSWHSTGWTGGRNVNRMLEFLWAKGSIMVAGRQGGQRLWDLADRVLPPWTPREALSDREVRRRITLRSLRALGVARLTHLRRGLGATLGELEREGQVERVEIRENGSAWPGPWYVSRDTLPLLERLSQVWQPRTTLLSPFDTLIRDRARTEDLFRFRFRMEIYVPQAKREYGYFVMPILYGDRLIGRIDPKMDYARRRLVINAVYAEPKAPMIPTVGREVTKAVAALAAFLGASDIEYGKRVPSGWAKAFTRRS